VSEDAEGRSSGLRGGKSRTCSCKGERVPEGREGESTGDSNGVEPVDDSGSCSGLLFEGD